MIKAILIDFGNVLAFFDHHRAIQRFAPDSALPMAEIYRAIYDGPLEHDFESGRIGGAEFLQDVVRIIGYRRSIEELRAAFVDIFSPNLAVLDLIPKLAERFRLVLASNTNELHAAHFRAQFSSCLQHFYELGLSFEAGFRKPAQEYFHYCLRLAQCRPNEAIFVDDIAVNVAGAAAVGLRAIRYQAGDDLAAQLRLAGAEF